MSILRLTLLEVPTWFPHNPVNKASFRRSLLIVTKFAEMNNMLLYEWWKFLSYLTNRRNFPSAYNERQQCWYILFRMNLKQPTDLPKLNFSTIFYDGTLACSERAVQPYRQWKPIIVDYLPLSRVALKLCMSVYLISLTLPVSGLLINARWSMLDNWERRSMEHALLSILDNSTFSSLFERNILPDYPSPLSDASCIHKFQDTVNYKRFSDTSSSSPFHTQISGQPSAIDFACACRWSKINVKFWKNPSGPLFIT